MKAVLIAALIGFCYCNPAPVTTVSDKDISVPEGTSTPAVEEPEQNAGETSVYLSEPIDVATKLLIALDEHVRKYLPLEEDVNALQEGAQVYGAGGVAEEASVEQVARQNQQMLALIDQVNRLAVNLETTITDLVSRRRYVTAAMLRSMLNYVRRVRISLERLQNRLHDIQAVATSGQNNSGSSAAIPGSQFFQGITTRVNRITEEVGALMTRIRGTFSPSAPAVTPSG